MPARELTYPTNGKLIFPTAFWWDMWGSVMLNIISTPDFSLKYIKKHLSTAKNHLPNMLNDLTSDVFQRNRGVAPNRSLFGYPINLTIKRSTWNFSHDATQLPGHSGQ